MNDDQDREFARALSRVARVRRKLLGIRMADLVTANSLKPANSTNGLSFEGLMKMLKGDSE